MKYLPFIEPLKTPLVETCVATHETLVNHPNNRSGLNSRLFVRASSPTSSATTLGRNG